MDEYLFTVLAKLKADRLKLERESRQLPVEERVELPVRRSPRARRSSPEQAELFSIVPTHGLRGWS